MDKYRIISVSIETEKGWSEEKILDPGDPRTTYYRVVHGILCAVVAPIPEAVDVTYREDQVGNVITTVYFPDRIVVWDSRYREVSLPTEKEVLETLSKKRASFEKALRTGRFHKDRRGTYRAYY